MRKLFVFVIVALLCPLLRVQAEGFVIRGRIAGMPDGVSVALLTEEKDAIETLAETTVRKGRFELRGKLENPMVCTLVTNNLSLVSEGKQTEIRWTYTPVFVENVKMTVETPHYDSIPHDAAVSLAFRITGGEIQRDFTEWHLLLQEKGNENRCAWEFIASHPQSAVSAWLGNRLMRQGYNLTIDEVERLERAIEDAPADPARFAAFRQNCAYARQTAKYRPLVDLDLNDMEGNACRLAEVVPAGKIVLVDFWATWCGPCMAAIAPIKELAERFPDRLAVIGVSCDENIAAWKAAIEKKQARWPQYVLTKQGYKDMLAKYQISGVPYFLLLDEQGRVISNPKHVEEIRRSVEELMPGEQLSEGVKFFEGTLEETLQEAQAQKKMLFIDAYTSWCGPCKWMSESEFKKPEAGAFFNSHFVNYKINVEKGDGRAFAEKYDVHGYPTFIVLNPDGTLRHRVLGADTLHLFIPMVEQGLDEKTSYAYLRAKYDAGTLTKQELPQAIRTFLTAGKKKEVRALCDSLYGLLSEKEKLSEQYWVVFERLGYDDLFSDRLEFLTTHTDKVGDGNRREDARNILRTHLSDHLINNTSGQITHKYNPWVVGDADEMPGMRALIGKSDLPDKAFWLAWCDLATACYYERADEVTAAVEKVSAFPEAEEYRRVFQRTAERYKTSLK